MVAMGRAKMIETKKKTLHSVHDDDKVYITKMIMRYAFRNLRASSGEESTAHIHNGHSMSDSKTRHTIQS